MKKINFCLLFLLLVCTTLYCQEKTDSEVVTQDTTTTEEESREGPFSNLQLSYFGEWGYTLGYIGKHGLEQAVKNGKLFLEPSLMAEVSLQGLWGKWGFSIGGEMLNIKPMEWWQKTYHEEGFRWFTYEIHLGVNPGFKSADEAAECITFGMRFISLTPPKFNPYDLPLSEIPSEQQRFFEEESVWGNEKEKSGIEVGISSIQKEENASDKSFVRVAIFYVDDYFGVCVSRRGKHGGIFQPIGTRNKEWFTFYVSPASLLGSFTLTWWWRPSDWDSGWYFNYSLLGFYF